MGDRAALKTTLTRERLASVRNIVRLNARPACRGNKSHAGEEPSCLLLLATRTGEVFSGSQGAERQGEPVLAAEIVGLREEARRD